jgi:hypothetical protein
VVVLVQVVVSPEALQPVEVLAQAGVPRRGRAGPAPAANLTPALFAADRGASLHGGGISVERGGRVLAFTDLTEPLVMINLLAIIKVVRG